MDNEQGPSLQQPSLQPVDAARFTPAELMLLYSSVSNYANYSAVSGIKDTVLAKIRAEANWRNSWNSPYMRLSQQSSETIEIAVRDVNDHPLFKFALCPESLTLADIRGRSTSNVSSNPLAFAWVGNTAAHGRGAVEISVPTTEGAQAICLDDIDIELLFAFYIYHSLKERNVSMSGIPFTAPATEGEPEG